MKTIGIHANVNKNAAVEVCRAAIGLLKKKNADIACDADTFRFLSADEGVRVIDKSTDLDALLVIGGDGTILRSAISAARMGVPVLGVNLGKLGFLSEVEPADLPAALDKLFGGEYDVEVRTMVHAESGGEECTALNDILLFKENFSHPIEVEISINDRAMASINCDGMLISTPTGSTAYALSAGGPIISPNVPSLLVIPICPHALSARPIVVSHSDIIKLRAVGCAQDSAARVSADGQPVLPGFCENSMLSVTLSDTALKFIHFRNYNFFDLLRKKLY